MSFDESRARMLRRLAEADPAQPEMPGRRSGLLRQGNMGLPSVGAPADGATPAQLQQDALKEDLIEREEPFSRWRFGKSSYARGAGSRASSRSAGKVGGPIGWLLRLALVGVFFVVVWQVQTHPAAPQTSNPSAQGAGTSNGAQATAPAGHTALLPPDQVATLFLSAYFNWNGAESAVAYVNQWAWMAAPKAQQTLMSAAPRAKLDGGADAEAQSQPPTLAANALQVQQQSAQAQARWTIQIIPPEADQATWQKRTIQATVTLAQTGSLWQVVGVIWSSAQA